MKKNIIVWITLLVGINSFSQDYPALDQVEKLITDTALSSFYPKLLARFNNFDPTLKINDYILLYYGFGYQDVYNGYRDDPSSSYYSMFQNKEYKKILNKCDSELRKVPVCISSNLYKGKVMKILYPDSIIYKQYMDRSYILMDILLESGDGETIETAYKVLFLDDERRIMYGLLEIKGYSKQALIKHYDELTVKKTKKYKKKKIYFDVFLPLAGTMRMLKKQK